MRRRTVSCSLSGPRHSTARCVPVHRDGEAAVKIWWVCALLLVSGCTSFAANVASISSANETVAKDRYGQYLTLNAAIQAYLGGDDDHLEISWNIQSGYRLYTDVTTVSDSTGALACEWTGMLERERVAQYGLTTTARILATTRCRRPIPGSPIPTLSIRHVGGTVDGHTFPPGEIRLVKKDTTPKYYSGLVVSDITQELMGLEPAFAYGGVLVHSTAPGSSSELSGLLRGDIITAVNGLSVRNARQFLYQFQNDQHQGLELELDVYRVNGRLERKRVILKRELSSSRPSGSAVIN